MSKHPASSLEMRPTENNTFVLSDMGCFVVAEFFWEGGEEPSITRDEALANVRLLMAAENLLALLRRWNALDGGSWHVERHAQEKTKLICDTREVLGQLELPDGDR